MKAMTWKGKELKDMTDEEIQQSIDWIKDLTRFNTSLFLREALDWMILLYEQKKQKQQFITCAAIWYDDGKQYSLQPSNIQSGIVIAGHRHPMCKIVLMSWLYPNWQTDSLQENLKNEVNNKEVQGFLTSDFRFVDRKEAAIIFQRCGGKLQYSKDTLYSEDLY